MKFSPANRGVTLAELLVVVAVVGIVISVSIPSLASHRRRTAVRAAANEMRSIVRFIRSRAILRNAHCAVKFRKDPEGWVWLAYDDGDGDGVRNDDIRRGVDSLARGPERLLGPGGPVRIALPDASIPDPDGGRRLRPGTSPVRFNQSALCSFSPIGSGTSGTVFVSDGAELVAAIRVYGPTGRVRIAWFDPRTGRWRN